MASISTPAPQSLTFLDLRRKTRFTNSLFLLSFAPSPVSSTLTSLLLRPPPPEAPRGSGSHRLRASVEVAQGSLETYGSEELEEDGLDAVDGPSRSDWGQQEEQSDAESQGGEVGEEGGGVEARPPSPNDRKIFIGGLHYSVDGEKLAGLFGEAGEVENATVVYNPLTNQSRGFGFVTMSTSEEVDKAIEMFNDYEFHGRIIGVAKAASKGSRPARKVNSASTCQAYVGNLPWQVDDAQLEKLFSGHGKVVRAQVICEKDSGRSRGYGFITMSTQEEISNVISALDGQILDGRQIKVSAAVKKERSRDTSFNA